METILDRDGLVWIIRNWLSNPESAYKSLQNNIPWKHDEVMMFGKKVTAKRMVCWMAEHPIQYRYSGVVKQAVPWHPLVGKVAQDLRKEFGYAYNSCLLNYYRSGMEGMGYHSDDEPELDEETPIASLSLGSSRPFFFKHKLTGETREVVLDPGGLLVMDGRCQIHWKHSLPVRKNVLEGRINLTFRCRKPQA